MAVISRTQVEIYFGPVKNVGIYIYGFSITCMLHVYTLHNTLNNANGAKKWDAIGGLKIMTGSPYSYYSRDPWSLYPYNIGDQGAQYHMDMGTLGPQNGGSPFSYATCIIILLRQYFHDQAATIDCLC